MKALKIFLTLFCMGVIVSCSKDEPAPAPTKEQSTPQQPNFPTIKNFSAQEVTVGDVITIEGENFNPSQTYTITFNGVKGTIKEVTSNHLKVEIPEEATSGEVILSSNETSKSIGRLTILPKPSVLYAYVAYSKIVKLDLQTGKEIETIAEVGNDYLSHIRFSKSTNEIIGEQTKYNAETSERKNSLFKLNLTTKQIVKVPFKGYERLIVANDELYAYVAYNKIVKLDLQTGKELETIAEIGKNYLSRIQFSKSTNEIIGLQSGNENEETYFKLNLKTKQFSRTPLKRYESFIIANY